jgi:hypothetical protein
MISSAARVVVTVEALDEALQLNVGSAIGGLRSQVCRNPYAIPVKSGSTYDE